MSAAAANTPVPRQALIVAGVMVAASLALAIAGRINGPVAVDPPPSAPAATRDLRFLDQPNGAVLIRDAATGATIATVPPGSGGFLRALVRGLGRTRRLREAGAAEDDPSPLRLTAYRDGRLTLEDVATHRHTDLEAFGATNEAVFAKLLNGAAPPNDHAPSTTP